MSNDIETKMTVHTVTAFSGGDKGRCIQVSYSGETGNGIDTERYIQLTLKEAAELCNTLVSFVRKEAEHRQELLKTKLLELRMAERNVFTEVMNLPVDMGVMPIIVTMIDKYTPVK